jgi:ATP-dependent RNA helicase HrpA
MEAAALTSLAELRASLPGLMARDQYRLARRLDRAAALRDARARGRAVSRVSSEVAAAQARVEARRGTVPVVTYPPELPVSQRKDEIALAISDSQVVIIAGETGSGKTTQLPKICLELGRGVAGQIGHTQPRRIAARTVAQRISEELRAELGTAVGYTVRFADTSSDGTLVKVMTDGILLTELQRDADLLRYDTLIIDEAHERSLNIDFILGYLKRLLPCRPDLKLIITSATIDPGRFSAHFSGAPVIEVSGRTYPVEVRYRPLADPGSREDEPKDQVQGICEAVAEVCREGPGDILVFLSGEREIRDTADALAGVADLEVLPLYARLSAAEQYRVFQPHRGRRVVLATNVAETSLTVPGIKYVIDPGTARISRYSHRTKVQRLPIEVISQASANQRKGRCGRTSDGVCIRLYSEEDFASRTEFTEPEILRTNLASVILRMTALGLGEMADFPFIDPPDSRNVADGVRLLEELGAISPGAGRRRLTGVGRSLAELPVDPRLGRMIVEAGRNGCAREVLIITAALSIQDPRERPAESREAADAMHARFAEPGSDFLAFPRLWEYLRERQAELSASAFRRLCRREYLHYLRVREWQDVHGQLRQAARDLGITIRRDPQPDETLNTRVHMSVLAGLLSHIGMKDTAENTRGDGKARGGRRPLTEFSGARGARFAIFPDSALARKPPAWVVAAELVETSRLWARTVASIEPEWAEPLAGHLLRRTYSEPHWDSRRGAVMASEKVTLYGLPIVAARPVNYGRIDPVAARELFISHALVEGDWETHHEFFHNNQELLDEAAELERRARRGGMVADDASLFDFYDKRIPASVTSARHFDRWWKTARAADPGLLTFSPADVAGPAAGEVRPGDYPSSWGDFALSYAFEPGEPGDGVTVDIPLATFNQVDARPFRWHVPGLREELVTELIRSLPKQLRTAFVPAPDTARAVLARLRPVRGDLLDALGAELGRIGGVTIPREAWDTSRLPAHLRITFRVLDGDQVLATGKDLAALRQQVQPRLRAVLSQAAPGITRSGLRAWDLGSLPTVFDNGQVRAYPALTDAGDAVDVVLCGTQAEASAAMWRGTRRLLMLGVPARSAAAASRLPVAAKLALSSGPYPDAGSLLDDCVTCASDLVITEAGGPSWDAEGFAGLLAAARTRLAAVTATVVNDAARVLAQAQEVRAGLDQASGAAVEPALADMRSQLSALIHRGFIAETGARRLPDLVRYLLAIARRLEKMPEAPGRDAERMAAVHRVTGAYERVMAELTAGGGAAAAADARAARWMIEELRVSLFAQTLGTPVPVSERRILTALERLRR